MTDAQRKDDELNKAKIAWLASANKSVNRLATLRKSVVQFQAQSSQANTLPKKWSQELHFNLVKIDAFVNQLNVKIGLAATTRPIVFGQVQYTKLLNDCLEYLVSSESKAGDSFLKRVPKAIALANMV